ncbi:MAG: response regulator [Chlorogloeopsis fritschii C42_A2020_084]|uniref:hybrid sensor histidine kinase/response regulator n=1 Tax=Chlorogloeopsis fritschii TaxID=1124 RepID=UPI0019E889A8|nr:hybrid sensor histidine kinase/response regulator [Chlorogloeopsis fritschii]MBF2007730.1 response regulator [Chlorogloeopsis fritschii C42_A2020_084]
MITDSYIREQGYLYFLTEAPELLQIIEQELFSLQEYSVTRVHNLIKIAHSLEDVFKSLYNPDVEIDNELRSLLFQAYECLQLALVSEQNQSNVNSDEILQRATTVFVQLQEKLGDAFGADTHIPTSEELGFDIVLSIFETGVTQRLESIAEVIQAPSDTLELADTLRSHAEIFLGLAESLNLPGFGEIAQTIITALTVNPTQALKIAEIALADLQQARDKVLAGDRIRGGEPSFALQALTKLKGEIINQTSDLSVELTDEIATQSINNNFLKIEFEEFYNFLTDSKYRKKPLKQGTAKFYLTVIRSLLGWFNHHRDIPEKEFSLSILIPNSLPENAINYIESWLKDFWEFLPNQDDSHSLCLYRQGAILNILLAISRFKYSNDSNNQVIETLKSKIDKLAKEYKQCPPLTEQEKNWIDNPKLKELRVIKEISASASLQAINPLLEAIWGEEEISTPTNQLLTTEPEIETLNLTNLTEHIEPLNVVQQETEATPEAIIEVVPEPNIIKNINNPEQTSSLPNKKSPQNSSVRVDVEALQRLNYLAGELLISQKQGALNDENITELIENLFQQLSRHQANLNYLREVPLKMQNIATKENVKNLGAVEFDSLEMDEYTEFNLVLHEAIEETLQLQETADSLNLLIKQAHQIKDKKQRLVLNMLDSLTTARMLPIGKILNRFPQMIQNLGNVYDKSVELILIGTEVLIDKAIAEKLYDPLLHLLRNAFDHGIESPQVRCERGKSEQGLIEIRAYNQGSQTLIEIRDDGQGLNLEKIRAKGIELNHLPDNDKVTSTEKLFELLFVPGFSTASKVSEISGRGIGLDIVRSQLEALNGSIAVQSVPYQGTKFTLKIPFSMTTEQLMIVQAGDAVYALLLDSIEKILLPNAEQMREFEGKKVLYWSTGKDECMVSIRQLSELMQYNSSFNRSSASSHRLISNNVGEMIKPVLLLRRNREILGVEVDQIIGEQELVIRPLGSAIAPPKYVYGCTTLANGTLILVIDGVTLLESAEMQATVEIMPLPVANSFHQKPLPLSGTTMQSQLLLAASDSTNSPTIPINRPLAPTYNTVKVILVVDDAISLRQTLSLTLQKSGYQVLQAQNGMEALEQLQRHPEVSLVISDLEMPRMNGFELLNNVRQNKNLASKPILILTSRSADKHRQLAQALGASAYLTKPYLEHEFLSIIKNLMNGEINNFSNLVMSN